MELKSVRTRFYRVKSGQTAEEIERELSIPLSEVFAGMIIPLKKYEVYVAEPFDDYLSVSKKFSIGEEELKSANLNRPIYPTAKVYIPQSL